MKNDYTEKLSKKYKDVKYNGGWISPLKQSIFGKISPKETIIDIGCSHGIWMLCVNQVLNRFGVNDDILKIGIDPNDYETQTQGSVFREGKTVKDRGDYDILLRVAIGLEDNKKREFYWLNEPGCNSFLKPNEEMLDIPDLPTVQNSPWGEEKNRKVLEVKEVLQRRLDSIFDELYIDSAYYIKTDCQGTDFQVIKSLGEYIHNVKYIEMEIDLDKEHPLYHGADIMEEVVEEMKDYNFELIEYTHHEGSPLPEGEALFKRIN